MSRSRHVVTPQPPCVAVDCRMPGQHWSGCNGLDEKPQCHGCLPALAAPGLALCRVHRRRLERDALALAELDHEIELVLTHFGGASDGGRHIGTSTGIGLNEKAVAVRSDMRARLVSMARMIGEERSVSLPADTVPDIARFVAKHADWLAAHFAASEHAEELTALRRAAWGAAYPRGVRIFDVGPCPECGAMVRAVLRDEKPADVACEGETPHMWTAQQLRRLGRRMSREYLSVADVMEVWGLAAGSVTSAATRHQWQRVVVHGQTRYAAVDVRATYSRNVENVQNSA